MANQVYRAGWKKVLTQVEMELWKDVKARCFREGLAPCEGVEAALRRWVLEGARVEAAKREGGEAGWMCRAGPGDLF